MSIFGRIFGKKPSDGGQPKPQPQQAVLVHLDGAGLPDHVYQECDLATIEDKLIEVIKREGQTRCVDESQTRPSAHPPAETGNIDRKL